MSTITVSGTATADVDFEEEVEIEDLSDREILDCVKEARTRRLINQEGHTPERIYVEEAYQELIAGRRQEAICLLDRALWPSTAFKAPLDILNKMARGTYGSVR